MSDLERRIRDLRRRGREAAEEARREEEEERRRSRARAEEAEDRMRRLRNSPQHRTQRQIGLLTEEVGGFLLKKIISLLEIFVYYHSSCMISET